MHSRIAQGSATIPLFAIFSLLSNLSCAQAQQVLLQDSRQHASANELDALRVSRNFVLTELEPGKISWELFVDLGDVFADRPIKLTLDVTNKTGRVLQFDRFSSNCRCTIQTDRIEELKDNSSAAVGVEVTPNKTSRLARGSVKFSLHDTLRGERIAVTCDYRLKGFLAFSQPLYQVQFHPSQLPNKPEPISLPFEFTAPVELRNLRVRGAGSFKDSFFKVDEKDNRASVLIEVDRTKVADGDLFGNIFLEDASTGKIADCGLSIVKMNEFEFSPRKIVMTLDENSHEFVGTGIFRLNINPSDKFLSDKTPLVLRVDADSSVGCKISSQRIDKFGMLHRITYSVENSETYDFSEGASVNISFLCSGKRFNHKCELLFLAD